MQEDVTVLIQEVKRLIDADLTSSTKREMRKALSYYDYKHDILKCRLFYFDNNDELKEEKYRSNTKIAHGFFTELIDQKVQYLLSNPIQVSSQQEGLQEYLDEYVNEDFQLLMQELVEGASQKGLEYLFWRIGFNGKILFSVANAVNVIPVYNELKEVEKVVYYVKDEVVNEGKSEEILRIQLWTRDQVYFFISEKNDVTLDASVEMNPVPHQLARDGKGEMYKKGNGEVPFIALYNNRNKTTDLAPIKDLIDDYDLMACSLSNNLIDFDHPIYAVRGYQGDNLDKLVTNLKTKKTVGVAPDGGIDVKTVEIPIEARKEKLRIDKEAIYKFGMGFDSSQTGDGNITNVVIKSRYSLLDLKCNKIEIRLRQVLKKMLELIVQNINELHGKAYNTSDLEIIITRDVMANEVDNATIAKIEEETKQVAISSILDASSRLDDETVLKLLAEVLDIDPDEVLAKLEEQGYVGDFVQESEVTEDGVEPVSEGDGATTSPSRQESQ